MKKALKIIFFILCVLFIAWVVISWFDIAAHNSAPWQDGYTQYLPFNFFELFF